MTTSTGEGRTEASTSAPRSIPQDTFAARLMLARLHAGGLTIQDAAERCGLTNQSWSNWEKGMKPRDLLDVVEAISDGLHVDRDWLLFGGPLAPAETPARRRFGRRNDGHGGVTGHYRPPAPRTPVAQITGHVARRTTSQREPRRPVLLTGPNAG